MSDLVERKRKEFRKLFYVPDPPNGWKVADAYTSIDGFLTQAIQEAQKETAEEILDKCFSENGFIVEDATYVIDHITEKYLSDTKEDK